MGRAVFSGRIQLTVVLFLPRALGFVLSRTLPIIGFHTKRRRHSSSKYGQVHAGLPLSLFWDKGNFRFSCCTEILIDIGGVRVLDVVVEDCSNQWGVTT